MSLQYGFNLHGWDKDAAKWQAKFGALGQNEKDYYHQVLPWALMMTDVSHISRETIPVLVFRLGKIDGGNEFIPKRDSTRRMKVTRNEPGIRWSARKGSGRDGSRGTQDRRGRESSVLLPESVPQLQPVARAFVGLRL